MSYQSFLFGAFENPFYITSRTNQLMLEFITNSNNSTFPGFELDYESKGSGKVLPTMLTLR